MPKDQTTSRTQSRPKGPKKPGSPKASKPQERRGQPPRPRDTERPRVPRPSPQTEKGAEVPERTSPSNREKVTWKPGTMLYPVPAVLVSCQGDQGPPNLITVAWTATVCTEPPMVAIGVRPERYSYKLIQESGEFVINLPDRSLARATDFCGCRSGKTIDKFAHLGLTPAPGAVVKTPILGEAPLSLECRLQQVLHLGSHHLMIGEVVAVRVDPTLLDAKGKLHLEKADLIAYSHGQYMSLGKTLGQFGFSVQKKRG